VIVSGGLVLQKVRSGAAARLAKRYQEEAQNSLTIYLLADISDVDPVEERELYARQLAPLVQELAVRSLPAFSFDRLRRRTTLCVTMLNLSKHLSGETQLRLNYAFRLLGFVDEEIRSARSSQWWSRARACYNLRLMQAADAIEVLSKNLEDEYEVVRIEAALSLLDIAGLSALAPVLLTIDDMSGWMKVRLSRSILGFGGDAVPHLVQGMKSDHPSVQLFCIEMLGRLGDVRAVQTLIEYINYAVPAIQMVSLEAFGRIGDARAVPVVLTFLESKEERIRMTAARALGSLGSPATVDALNKLLLHDTIAVRLAAAEALSKIGGAGIRTLQYSSQSDNEEARLVALQYLHEQELAREGAAP
jgi:HEAT repeat protein